MKGFFLSVLIYLKKSFKETNDIAFSPLHFAQITLSIQKCGIGKVFLVNPPRTEDYTNLINISLNVIGEEVDSFLLIGCTSEGSLSLFLQIVPFPFITSFFFSVFFLVL